MHLKFSPGRRFYILFNTLAEYVNETRSVLDHPFNPYALDQTYERDMRAVLKSLWDDRSIIDQFIADNPARFSRADLAAVSDWNYGLHDDFLLMKYESGYAHFMVDDMIYEVSGLSIEISDMIPEDALPRSVATTLLPYDGGIVYDTQIYEVSVVFTSRMLEMLTDQYETAKARGNVYRSAQALIRNAEYHAQVELSRENDARLDEYEREQRRADPSKIVIPEGMHNGALAGVPFAKREALQEKARKADKEARQLYEERRDGLIASFPKKEPQTSLEGAMNAATKEQLMDTARDVDMPGRSNLKKSELIEALLEVSDLAYILLDEFLVMSDNRQYKLFMQLLDSNGYLARDISKIETEDLLRHRPPFICHYRSGSQLITVLPKEFVEVYRNLDAWDLRHIATRRSYQQHFRDCANAAVSLYGVISFSDFVDMYWHYYPKDDLEISDLLEMMRYYSYSDSDMFGIWLNFEAAREQRESEGSLYTSDIYNAYYMLNMELMISYDLRFNGYEEGWDESRIDAEEDKSIEDYRNYLLERHKTIPRYLPKKSELKDFDFLTRCRKIPEAQKLISYLDIYVPDGQDDMRFADSMFAMFLLNLQFGASVSYFNDKLIERGYVFDSAYAIEDFMAVLSDAMNSLPRWTNNGHSPKTLRKELGIPIP